jgi:hypothetical protein
MLEDEYPQEQFYESLEEVVCNYDKYELSTGGGRNTIKRISTGS